MNQLILYRPWFFRFVLYNLIFLSLQFAYVLSQGNNFIQSIPLPIFVRSELVVTAFIHLGLYLLLSILQTALLWGVMQWHFKLSIQRCQMIIWCLSIFALIASNGYFFPLSVFSRLFLPELPHVLLITGLFLSLVPLCLLTLNLLLLVSLKYLFTTALLAAIVFCLSYFQTKPLEPVHSSIKPNIILIGIDSLPPAGISAQNTPTINQFIKESVQFKNTISPLARTYPAWTTILTGLYPLHHGARYNLMPQHLVKSDKSIVWHFRNSGYQTIFATDDRRFNNMGNEFGFQKIIGPKTGVNDVLLGTFNDFPLSNLLINLPPFQHLFPYNHMNRASHYTYYPQTFNKALQNVLAVRDYKTPLFFAVHFTVAHWPYAFASSSPAQVNDEYSVTEREQLFSTAIHEADQQIKHLLNVLQKYHYLDNSLVILLSDHGETLYTPGSRQTRVIMYQGQGHNKLAEYFKSKTSTSLDRSAGHGSDLLSSDQYHCVLACKIYKNGELLTQAKQIDTRVSLIDIAPTVQSFAGSIKSLHFDGISLLNSLVNQHSQLPNRAFIMESGMLPNQFLSREKARVLGQQLFTVNKQNGLLQIRNRKLASLDAMKLYAIIKDDWVLALYPDDNGYIPVIQRLSDGAWMDALDGNFVNSSPARNMLEHMRQFYNKSFAIYASSLP